MKCRPVNALQASAAVALTLTLQNFALAVLISPTIAEFSSQHGVRPAVNVVNGSGLTAGPSGILGAADSTHNNAHETIWHQATQNNGSSTFISFDLGTLYNLDTTRIWNLNQVGETFNGAKDIEVYVSADNSTFNYLSSHVLTQGGGTAFEPAQNFSTIAPNVQYVKFVIPTGYAPNGEGWKGLGEVRFEGSLINPNAPQPVPATVSGVSSQLRSASHTVDGSGFTGTTHGNVADGAMWTTNGNILQPNDTTAPYIIYDLGAAYDITELKVWNFNEDCCAGFGAKNVQIMADLSADPTTSQGNFVLTEASGQIGDPGQTIAVDFQNVRYIRINILDTYDGAIFGTSEGGADGRFVTGLSEIRFVGLPAAPVPEPSTFVLAGTCLIALGACRRRARG